MSKLPPAIFLMGATGTGKTDLAVALHQHLPIEIISVDSALIYKSMDIGTAKPDAKTLELAPHRLIDLLDPAEAYSAANFREDALREMAEITAAGRIPVLAGGTMLYYRALEKGLSVLPEADPVIREAIEAEAKASSWQALHEQLQQIDPIAAARIHPNDPQRLSRALEVFRITGKSMTALQAEQQQDACPYNLLKIALVPEDRAWLHQRLEQRFDIMLDNGLLAEVEHLYNRGDLHINLPAIRCVGYRQVWEHLDGKIDYNTMRNRAIVATRQLAKRQLTWLRSENDLTTYYAENIHLPSAIKSVSAYIS